MTDLEALEIFSEEWLKVARKFGEALEAIEAAGYMPDEARRGEWMELHVPFKWGSFKVMGNLCIYGKEKNIPITRHDDGGMTFSLDGTGVDADKQKQLDMVDKMADEIKGHVMKGAHPQIESRCEVIEVLGISRYKQYIPGDITYTVTIGRLPDLSEAGGTDE